LRNLWRLSVSDNIIQLADAYRALFLTACEVCDRLCDYGGCSELLFFHHLYKFLTGADLLSKVVDSCAGTILEDEDMDPWLAYQWMNNNMAQYVI
jgi:hypothetical protein